jgi:hypothetical protein
MPRVESGGSQMHPYSERARHTDHHCVVRRPPNYHCGKQRTIESVVKHWELHLYTGG